MLIRLQALAYKNTSSLHHSKSQTNQVALASNSCHRLSLNFALFISSHMNFENVVCQLHQHYRFPNLFVVGPAYEILDKNPFIHSVFGFTVDTHMTTNRFSHNSTFSFISFGVLCSPVILTSCSLTIRWCGYATCAENNKKSSPSQGPGSTAAQGAPCPRVWVTLTAATKRLLRKRRPNFRKPHCFTRGLQGTAAELQDSRARRPSTTTPVWSPTTLWATGEYRWYGWMCF